MFYYKLSDSCFTEIVLQVLYVILLSLNRPHISPQNGMETLRNEKTPNSFPQMLYFVLLWKETGHSKRYLISRMHIKFLQR